MKGDFYAGLCCKIVKKNKFLNKSGQNLMYTFEKNFLWKIQLQIQTRMPVKD
jgi:hypothetical protein